MHSLQAVIDNATGTSSGMGDPLSIQEPDRAEPRAQRNPLRRSFAGNVLATGYWLLATGYWLDPAKSIPSHLLFHFSRLVSPSR
jgi:hypothetical protein